MLSQFFSSKVESRQQREHSAASWLISGSAQLRRRGVKMRARAAADESTVLFLSKKVLWKKLSLTPRFSFSAVFLFLLSSIFTLLSFCTSSVDALGLVGTTDHIITSGGFGRPLANNTLEILYPVNRSGNDVWVNIPGAYTQNITAMNLNVSTPIPANSLVSLSISYDYLNESSTGIKYYGLQFEHNRSLLYDSCENIIGQNLYVANSGSHITWTCTYVFYNQDQTSIIDSSYGSHIFERIQPTDNLIDVLNIVIGPASSVQLSNDGLSSSDRTWLQTQLGNIDTSAVVSKLNEVKSEQQNTTRAIQAQTTQQHDDYEAEVEREEDKQEELEDQSEDLTLSTPATGNPFASYFTTTDCVSMPTISGWFNTPSTIRVCTPYPQSIRPILNFVTSALVVLLLIRLYYKHLDGGYAS